MKRIVSQIGVVSRNEILLLRSELIPVALYFVMPVAILAFVQGAFESFMQLTQPELNISGADLAAPGLATMFGFMSLAIFGHFFLGEHGWGTWNRVRSMGVGSWQILCGKSIVNYVQQILLFGFVMFAGYLLFDLEVRGSLIALLAVELMLALCIVGYGLVACALSTTQAQYNAFAYLGALVMAGLGGALTPFATLPDWAQAIAPATPTYWAIRGFEGVIVDGQGLVEVRLEICVLALFSAVAFIVASMLFDPSRRRSTWA